MNGTAMTILAGAGALSLTAMASAQFTGVDVRFERNGVDDAGSTTDIYRLWAQFTSPSDGITFWGGGSMNSLSINQLDATGASPGSGFYSISGSTAVHSSESGFWQIDPNQTADSSYITIGVEAGYDPNTDIGQVFALTPGAPPDAFAGSSTSVGSTPSSEWAIVTEPGAPNSVAGTSLGLPTETLLAQFAVQQGENVEGQGTLGTFSTVRGREEVGFSFTTVPTPGALALLVVAGIAAGRRRR